MEVPSGACSSEQEMPEIMWHVCFSKILISVITKQTTRWT
jgi:hypothetical protein